MSIAYAEHPAKGYVEIVVNGGISAREIEDMMPRLEGFVASHGEVSVLQRIERPGLVNPLAALPHAGFGLRMLGKVRRVAVVTDLPGLGPLTWLAGALSPIETRRFPLAGEGEARAWLAEAAGVTSPA